MTEVVIIDDLGAHSPLHIEKTPQHVTKFLRNNHLHHRRLQIDKLGSTNLRRRKSDQQI